MSKVENIVTSRALPSPHTEHKIRPVCDPASRYRAPSRQKRRSAGQPAKPQVWRGATQRRRGRICDARTRREKARVPFPEPGSHKLPQCGRFRAIGEYSVWPIQFLKLCHVEGNNRKNPQYCGLSEYDIRIKEGGFDHKRRKKEIRALCKRRDHAASRGQLPCR